MTPTPPPQQQPLTQASDQPDPSHHKMMIIWNTRRFTKPFAVRPRCGP